MRVHIIHIIVLLTGILLSCQNDQVLIYTNHAASSREKFGIDKLEASLQEIGYGIKYPGATENIRTGKKILIGDISDSLIYGQLGNITLELPSDGYIIKSVGNTLVVAGKDPSGTLYACLELADRIMQSGQYPARMDLIDSPEMLIRGACVGLQKTEYLPGRNVYEYPITPDNFPWFYQKELWIRYLDLLVENRMNSLFLWNGHPFASLVKLKDYPFAVEVDDEVFRMNEELYSFITHEADKRGIWVIQMFYNIIVSKPFAEHYGLETQNRNRSITPLISDYTQKSLAAFIEKYPNVGLLVCLGEAMNIIEDDIEWFTQTIIPGVKEGLLAKDITSEPPIILRGHDTDAKRVMEMALPLYNNLYTMHKFNGESLITYEPRGSWAEIHQELSKLGPVHISNVHILANLEPFRYGSPDFIQRSVTAMHDIQGANGLHLYPQSAYWDWPYTADNTNPRLLQIDRDWIWYKAWGRYAWNCRRNRDDEIEYWSDQLESYYGCSRYAEQILKAYEETGEIAPKLSRRFGITDGNRQTLLLGMFMSQLVNPYKWRVYSNFYTSNGPEGEILIDYAEKEWKQLPHRGETPPQIIEEVVNHSRLAVEAIEKVSPYIRENQNEFSRLKNDVYCYSAIANFYSEKVKAAMLVLRYKYSREISDLERALPHLEKSVEYYAQLTELTRNAYLYANSMQTRQRRIPIDGTEGKFKTWEELLPKYEAELANFRNNIEHLKSSNDKPLNKERELLIAADAEILSQGIPMFKLEENQKIYSDRDYIISELADELNNLKAIRLSFDEQLYQGTKIRFRNKIPVKLVVGYFNGHSYSILQPPSLETDASATGRGQADLRIANAIEIPGLYPVNIYTYYYEPGEHTFEPGKGILLILGFMDGQQEIETYDAGTGTGNDKPVDWLFY